MWIAKDKFGDVFGYEKMPERADNIWQVSSGAYFDIPNIFVNTFGNKLKWENDPIEVEIRDI